MIWAFTPQASRRGVRHKMSRHGSAAHSPRIHAPHAASCTAQSRSVSLTATSAGPTATSVDRCDRWSSALQRLGVSQGDRVAYIAPNTHAQLESFYAVPQIGAVLVPINFRLVADDFRYLIQHSGAKVVCAGADHIAAVDSIRRRPEGRRPFRLARCDVRAERGRLARLRIAASRTRRELHAPDDRRARSADDQLHQRHDVAAQGRDDHASQRVDELRRHAGAHADDTGRRLPLDAADVPRQRLDVHVDRHGRRRRSTCACRSSMAATIFKVAAQEKVTRLCAAPTVLIMLANAPAEVKAHGAEGCRRDDGGRAAGRGHDSADRGRSRAGRSSRSTASPKPRRRSASASRGRSTSRCRPTSARRSRRGRASS